MRYSYALLVCLLLLAGCGDDGYEPWRPPPPAAPPAPPPEPEWRDPVIKDAKVSDHVETESPPLTPGKLREWFADGDFSRLPFRLFRRRDPFCRELLGCARELLDDPSVPVRKCAAEVVGLTALADVRALPGLSPLARDPSEEVAEAALGALSLFGPYAASAVPDVIEALSSPHRKVRIAAARTIGDIGPAARDALPRLIEMLGSDDGEVVAAALEGLAGLGPLAAPALGRVIPLLRCPDRQEDALIAIGSIGRAAREALPEIESPLGIRDERRILLAAWARWRLGASADSLLGEIEPIAWRPRGWRSSLWAWRSISSVDGRLLRHPSFPAVSFPRLTEGADPGDTAVALLGLMGPDARAAIPTLVSILQTTPGREDEVVGWALLRIGPDSGPVLARHLVELDRVPGGVGKRVLRSARSTVTRTLIGEMRAWRGLRGRAALRLAMDHMSREDLLIELRYGNPISKVHLVRAWQDGRLHGEEFDREVRRRLHDPDLTVRRAAALAVKPRSSALWVLREMLSSEEAEERSRAADAIAQFGRRGWPAAPDLARALTDPNPLVRWSAADAIGAIGPGARRALRAVWNSLSDPNPDVARAAERALRRIQ
ncbi:MAG: HEAT repeat domain-containing protein [Planctomycetota bacterium]